MNLKEKINNLNLKFEKFFLPAILEDDLINGYGISIDAAITIRNLTGYQEYDKDRNFKRKYKYSYSDIKESVVNNNLQLVEDAINCSTKNTLDIVVVNNTIVGFYKNYNGVHHQEVYNKLSEYGLLNRVKSSLLADNLMIINLYVLGENEYYWLRFTNGLDSWDGLGYKAVFMFNKLEFDLKDSKLTKRHLSNVDEVFIKSKEFLAELSQINAVKVLEEENKDADLLPILEKYIGTGEKEDILVNHMQSFCESMIINTAKDFMVELCRYAENHGYKGIIKRVGQQILNELFGV